MVNRHNRLLVTFPVIPDPLLGVSAFIIAYKPRLQSILRSLITTTTGMPPFQKSINQRHSIAVLVPLGSTAILPTVARPIAADDFAVFVGSISPSSSASWRRVRETFCQQRGAPARA